jgi:hypothetical protein
MTSCDVIGTEDVMCDVIVTDDVMWLYCYRWRHVNGLCCQMAEFWAAGLKNGPVKLLAA